MQEEQDKQAENKPQRDELGRLLPGSTANPNGRPKQKTIRERIRERLDEHPEEMDAFVQYFIKENRALAWQMLEGRPIHDITSRGMPLNPTPIYGGLSVNLPPPIDDVRENIQTVI
jgi:hypothetical protein